MILGYIDESGKSHELKQGMYVDGPYAIWSCVLISEKKYFDIERAFQELASKYLNIKRKELHASEIWETRKKNLPTEKKVRQYFEELFQLTSKLHIPVLLGIQQKNFKLIKKTKRDNLARELELEKARHSLLTLIESELAKMNETAVLVSDEEGSKDNDLQNLVYKRTKWRYSPPNHIPRGHLKPKYIYEYQSNFLIDQLHYVNSADSLLMQFADHICFVLRKVLEHLYLLNFPKPDIQPTANQSYVPISESTFNAFANFCDVSYATYLEGEKDVLMAQLSHPSAVSYTFNNIPTQSVVALGNQNSLAIRSVLKDFTPFG